MAAGVDHFYIYDNESPDNQREVAAPYIKAGLVDYFPALGKALQMVVYNDAVKRFKFHCRYMAFIDGDEFIYPKTNRKIVEVVDEILSQNSNAAAVAVNWQLFGSNGQETADYSRGVLERFTRRATSDFHINEHIKTIANPRAIEYMITSHSANYFEERFAVNEAGKIIDETSKYRAFNRPPLTEKIVVNHYHCKSREEYRIKRTRGIATHFSGPNYSDKQFDSHDRNEEFDDGILRYRDERAKIYRPPNNTQIAERMLNALMKNLSPTLLPTTPQKFYAGKVETFLTCRAVSSMLKSVLPDAAPAKFFEEASLKAILRSLNDMSFADARLFVRELPKLLSLPYPITKNLREAAIQILTQMINLFRVNNMWKNYVEVDYIRDLLKILEVDKFAER